MATKRIDVIVEGSIDPLEVKNEYIHVPDKNGRLRWGLQITVPLNQTLREEPDVWLDVRHKNRKPIWEDDENEEPDEKLLARA